MGDDAMQADRDLIADISKKHLKYSNTVSYNSLYRRPSMNNGKAAGMGFLYSYITAWNWRLYFFILLFFSLPNIYQIYRTGIIGTSLPDPGSLAIISQWQFVGLIIEIFQEATVLAIFFFIGSQIRNSAAVQIDRAKTVLFIIFVASLAYSAGIFMFTDAFIEIIGTPEEIQEQTRQYLEISVFSLPFTVLAAAIVVLFESLGMRRLVLIMAFVNIALLFGLDMLFFGSGDLSLQADVIGVAWSTLLASLLLFLFGLGMLFRTKRVQLKSLVVLPSFAGLRTYLRVGMWSGTDSAIRNAAYFVMIIGIVNSIGAEEIGGYYIFIQIMWSFMLVPVLAFAESAKALVANASGDLQHIRKLWLASMLVTALMIVIVWLPVLAFFGDIAGTLTGDASTIRFAIVAFGILLFPYVLFSFNTVTDSVFYGIGKTRYMALQSIITNGTVYVIAYAFYTAGTWIPTFEDVMWLFFYGIVVDSGLTIIFLWKVLYSRSARRQAGLDELKE